MTALTTKEDLAWWGRLAPSLAWRVATTMPDAPHSYVVKGKTLGDEAFDRAVRVIRTYGQPQQFWGRTGIYLVIDDMKWWTMGAPLSETIIINQAEADQTFGPQLAPVTFVPDLVRSDVYDAVATQYDSLYLSPEDLAENELVRKLLHTHFGNYAPSTLDVGCGTGLLLDLGVVSSKLYVGIDPSQGMLNELVRKYPKLHRKSILPGTLASRLPELRTLGRHFELVCALFGAASYMEVAEWEAMLGLSRDLVILMTLHEGYLPGYWTGEAREQMLPKVAQASYDIEDFSRRHGGTVVELANENLYVFHPVD